LGLHGDGYLDGKTIGETIVLDDFKQALTKVSYQNGGSDNFPLGNWIASKFQLIAYHPLLQSLFQISDKPRLDFSQLLEQNKIVLINLAKGNLGEAASRFLGMMLVHSLYQAILKRAKLPIQQRKPVLAIVDEFHSIATQSFIGLLSEGRKFGVMLTLANQFLGQLRDPRVMQGLLGNVGTLVSFRVGSQDASHLESEFALYITAQELINLGNWKAVIKTVVGQKTTRTFDLETLAFPEPNAVTWHEAVEIKRMQHGLLAVLESRVEAEDAA
jgi:hypothetical protein